jgi:hypothetical protein
MACIAEMALGAFIREPLLCVGCKRLPSISGDRRVQGRTAKLRSGDRSRINSSGGERHADQADSDLAPTFRMIAAR